MNRKILCGGLAAALTLALLCGCGTKTVQESSPKASVASAEPSRQSSAASKAQPEPESAEPSGPVQPSLPERPDIEMKSWTAENLNKLIEKSKVENVNYETYEYVPVEGSDKLFATRSKLTVTGLFDDVLTLSEYLSKQEKNNIYISDFSLYSDYNDDIHAEINIINPYPANEISNDEDLKEYIYVRFNSIDKNGIIKAFVDENANYYLKTASCDFTPAEDGNVTILAGIDFATYNGFVAYRYKLGKSLNFILDENAAITEKSEPEYYDDKKFHADIILTTNKFNR